MHQLPNPAQACKCTNSSQQCTLDDNGWPQQLFVAVKQCTREMRGPCALSNPLAHTNISKSTAGHGRGCEGIPANHYPPGTTSHVERLCSTANSRKCIHTTLAKRANTLCVVLGCTLRLQSLQSHEIKQVQVLFLTHSTSPSRPNR